MPKKHILVGITVAFVLSTSVSNSSRLQASFSAEPVHQIPSDDLRPIAMGNPHPRDIYHQVGSCARPQDHYHPSLDTKIYYHYLYRHLPYWPRWPEGWHLHFGHPFDMPYNRCPHPSSKTRHIGISHLQGRYRMLIAVELA